MCSSRRQTEAFAYKEAKPAENLLAWRDELYRLLIKGSRGQCSCSLWLGYRSDLSL